MIERPTFGGWAPMQYRVSCDGIVWSGWRPLLSVLDPLNEPDAVFVQARIFMDNDWQMSPVSLWH